ncbi:Nif3-like dinuclear metal center hexameric protein [Clostridium oryzae]|uniref:GTP cyclohydrolase 1 type 2 homolog n=1 Tax=Clostridium oryzae TaxID=1450648 RepID=A0A1V4IHK9_9CLOT|nr:Nif3-like dinuclear metal center hexameric protein [Clostridium oryzae]OPJ59443.1 putative GTP cyclohydrolase 1 type 2 [Clostridium oryzae]
MSIKLKKLIEVIENIAPLSLAEDYDNVGLMIGNEEADVSSALITLDCTLDVIQEAIDKKVDLIISHHPLLFVKPKNVTENSLQGKKMIKLIKNNINVYASHTNLDCVAGGLNDIIVKLLGFTDSIILEKSPLQHVYKNSGIGRLVKLDESVDLFTLCELVKNRLGCPKIRCVGEMQWSINKIAIINGSGEDYFHIAVKEGADCIISGDSTYHYASDMYEEQVALIDAGHFGTEWPAMKYFGSILENKCIDMGAKVNFTISQKNKDPYRYI